MASVPTKDLVEGASRVLGPVSKWVRAAGGWTAASHWRVELPDGRRAFVKAGASPDTDLWLRDEYRNYERIKGPFMPQVLGWDDLGEHPILVLEDLGEARWPPPWLKGDLERVLMMLDAVATHSPEGLASARDHMGADLDSWPQVLATPGPFLALRLCTEEWLASAGPQLLEVSRLAVLEGSSLLHCDVRSDNIAFDGERTLLVDWNWACMGNPVLDVAAWAPSVTAEGGPPPWDLAPGQAEFACALAGYWAARAPLPPPFTGSRVREVQLQQLKIALPWAAREVGLESPDPGC